MHRRLFCELSPLAYRISVEKSCALRTLRDGFSAERFPKLRLEAPLPALVCRHNSLIRRTLGRVDPVLQDNKAVNLALAAPKINGILIRPGETFSFWHLVGRPSVANGYRTGMVIANAQTGEAVGGGMCQFSNLIHWMVLHAPLTITEQHHHDQFDLFPDFGRQVPFGTGTSIFYNYLDYRFRNDTEQTYQLLVHTTPTHLCGELRTDAPLASNTTSRRRTSASCARTALSTAAARCIGRWWIRPPGMCSRASCCGATMPACSTIRRDWRSWTGKKRRRFPDFGKPFFLKISETFCFCVARGGTSVVY